MAYRLGAASLQEGVGVHPGLMDVVKIAIGISPVDFSLHDGLRTEQEQAVYVRTGVSQTMESKHRRQPDGFGHATDLVPFINGKKRWEWPPIYEIAAVMGQALRTYNAGRPAYKPLRIRWGGCWRDLSTIAPTPDAMEQAVEDYGAARRKAGRKAFTDGPHFEVMV